MSLALLLDENVSPVVAERTRAQRPDIRIESIYTWRDGAYVSASDDALLAAARADGLVLVTYDIRMLSDWSFVFGGDPPFAGVVFVDSDTVPLGNFGGLVRALIELWDRHADEDWSCRIVFLKARA